MLIRAVLDLRAFFLPVVPQRIFFAWNYAPLYRASTCRAAWKSKLQIDQNYFPGTFVLRGLYFYKCTFGELSAIPTERTQIYANENNFSKNSLHFTARIFFGNEHVLKTSNFEPDTLQSSRSRALTPMCCCGSSSIDIDDLLMFYEQLFLTLIILISTKVSSKNPLFAADFTCPLMNPDFYCIFQHMLCLVCLFATCVTLFGKEFSNIPLWLGWFSALVSPH